MRTINLRLPITIIEAGQVPFFVARDKGFYAEKELQVNPVIGDPRHNSLEKIAGGEFDIGVLGGPETLIKARADGLPLKAFGLMHHNSNFPCLLTMQNNNITDLKQLHGKKVGFFYGHISTEILRCLFRQEGVGVEEVDVGFDYNRFLNGELDAIWAFRVTAAVELLKKNIPINIINPADYGISTDGYTLFASDKLIEEEPQLIQDFSDATFKGLEYSLKYPEEAVRTLLNADPYADIELNLERLKLYNEVTATKPFGFISSGLLEAAYTRLKEHGLITNRLKLAETFTDKFILPPTSSSHQRRET